MPDRPNVLFLLDDQHRPDVAGFAGDSTVRTPTLDWLAEDGVVFENAYTPCPVCVPARHSIRTGQLPRTWDRVGFEAFEAEQRPTLPRQLGCNDYLPVQSGKEHYPGLAQMQGWRKRLGPTPNGYALDDELEGAEAPEQSGYGPEDWKWSAAKEITRAGVADSRIQVQDRRCTAAAEQFVEEYFSSPYYDRAQPDRPLVLKTSLLQPHYPYFTEHEERFTHYLNRVDPIVERPGAVVGPADEGHPVLDRANTAGECRLVDPETDVSHRDLRRATAAYYAMVETVDDLFGRVIDALRHNGEDPDEWLIVFTSDHGELMGERGMWGKGQFLESSARVPLVIRYPERFDGGRVTENVSLCDLYATICDVGGVPVPNDLDSRSLVGLMEGETGTWHERYHDEAICQGASNQSVAEGLSTTELMIKREDLKYCYFGEDRPEVLFDLERDPEETTNVVSEARYENDLEAFRSRRDELGYGPNADPDYRSAGYR
jgi:choline-sulfatase